MTESVEVRASMVDALRLDLVGPTNDHPFAREVLPDPPQQWYATGFLVPRDEPKVERPDETSADEDIDAGDAEGQCEGQTDRIPAQKGHFPSSLGVTFLIPEGCRTLDVSVEWGDYRWVGARKAAEDSGSDPDPDQDAQSAPIPELPEGTLVVPDGVRGYARLPRSRVETISVEDVSGVLASKGVEGSEGLKLQTMVRRVDGRHLHGTRSVSLFLVNERLPQLARGRSYEGMAFQARLVVRCADGFVPRPDLRGHARGKLDWDERLADLHYRDCYEFAVGHGTSVLWVADKGVCREIRTEWIPEATVERVDPAALDGGVELSMAALGGLDSSSVVDAALAPLVPLYRAWIATQDAKRKGLGEVRSATADVLVSDAKEACGRIEKGIALLKSDPQVLKAFAIANRAMARAARKRRPNDEPSWRPFQLAFFLLNLRGIAEPGSDDRKIVDLLFFPTGGGKTEAYLGLAAFTLVLRRLRHPDKVVNGVTVPASAGVTILMRYTLRLLTLDQMGRAAALMCALELERDGDPSLGSWPFEIGLWVGSAATPNRMGSQGDSGAQTAIARLNAFLGGARKESPIPLGVCPWCGEPLTRDSFHLVPDRKNPSNLAVSCVNPVCEFGGDRYLPVVSVDEPIYQRLPAFLLATVDKFAALPWTGECGALFGKVSHYDPDIGFTGPADAKRFGTPLSEGLLPPELVIQDELHLISGPLGTIAGLYEIAIEALARDKDGKLPKIVASTATVRRADRQIRSLFGRPQASVFPPPGLDRTDSFFARTTPASVKPGRLYVGVAAPGRNFKVLQMRVARALLSHSFALWSRYPKTAANPADPYVTLLGYFNALRELGGFRRIAEDEILSVLEHYGNHRRRWTGSDPDRLFVDRKLDQVVQELTSRVSTSEVADTKVALARSFHEKSALDMALATNMISVGLDISRLGLLTVHGQPKSSAEYIQATSRVGRAEGKPGLVVTMLNVAKARDRSHFEHFKAWHQSFYRSVEPTSITPYSPRALDRALVGSLVGLARHLRPDMVPSQGAQAITVHRTDLEEAERLFEARVQQAQDGTETDNAVNRVRASCKALLDDWEKLAKDAARNNGLRYESGERLLRDPLDPTLKTASKESRRFRAARSMRDVEPTVNIWVE